MGSNLDTLVSIGLDRTSPPDYRLAQQVCQAIANISDRRKVGSMATGQPRGRGPPTLHPTRSSLVFLHSLPWANATLPSGCLRNMCYSRDFGTWSQQVSYPKGPGAGQDGAALW